MVGLSVGGSCQEIDLCGTVGHKQRHHLVEPDRKDGLTAIWDSSNGRRRDRNREIGISGKEHRRTGCSVHS